MIKNLVLCMYASLSPASRQEPSEFSSFQIEATQGQRTQEPTTQVTLRRRGKDRTQAMSKNPKRAQIGSLWALYTTEHVLNMWYTCGVHVGMTSECYVRSETSRD